MTSLEYFQILEPVKFNLFIEEAKRQGRDLEKIRAKASVYNVIGSISWMHSLHGMDFWVDLAIKYRTTVTPKIIIGYYI